MSYVEAQFFMAEEGITTEPKFRKWKKAGKRPSNFPSHPEQVYKEWVSWFHFFGTEERIVVRDWMSFQEARAFVQKEGIKTSLEFRKWIKSENKALHLPNHPERVYKEEWVSWPHFFGRDWMNFQEARAYIQKEGIKTSEEFRKWSKAGKRPPNFPSNPHLTYKDWVSWSHFFGTEGSRKDWMSYVEAKALMQTEGIKTSLEFIEWNKAGKRPPNFPSNPQVKYKKYWKGWPHFLGTKKCKKAFK